MLPEFSGIQPVRGDFSRGHSTGEDSVGKKIPILVSAVNIYGKARTGLGKV